MSETCAMTTPPANCSASATARGGVVAADAELLSGRLAVDESALTGESIPVQCAADDAPAVSAGTTVAGGRALARVTATGPFPPGHVP